MDFLSNIFFIHIQYKKGGLAHRTLNIHTGHRVNLQIFILNLQILAYYKESIDISFERAVGEKRWAT